MTSNSLATGKTGKDATAQPVRSIALLVGLCGVFYVGLVCSIAVVNTSLAAQLTPFQLTAPSPHGKSSGLARGKFLVAAQHLDDPNFSESVVLLLGYGQQGALGVIINRPTTVPLAEVLPDAVQAKPESGLVYRGGPVARTAMLVLLRSTHQSDEIQQVFDDVYFSHEFILKTGLSGEKREAWASPEASV